MSEPAGIVAALVAFQAALPRVEKTSTAQYGAYADLADVSGIVLPRLAAVGIAYTAYLVRGEETLSLHATLRHVSGETIACDWPVALQGPQQMGSAITYGRRYCLLAMCGVHPAGEDDDAQLASKDHAKLAKDTVKAPRKATRASTTRDQEDPWATDVPPVTHTPPRAQPSHRSAPGADPELTMLANNPSGSTVVAPDTPPRTPPPPSRGAGADTLTAAQLKMIATLMGGKGIVDKAAVLDYVEGAVGRRVDSRKDLTRAEAGMLIDALTYVPVDVETGEMS